MIDDPHDIDEEALRKAREALGLPPEEEPKPFVVTAGFPGHIEFEHRENFASFDTFHFWLKFPTGSHEHIRMTSDRGFAEREIKRYLAMGVKVEKWSPY